VGRRRGGFHLDNKVNLAGVQIEERHFLEVLTRLAVGGWTGEDYPGYWMPAKENLLTIKLFIH